MSIVTPLSVSEPTTWGNWWTTIVDAPNDASYRPRCGLVALDFVGLLDPVVDCSERLLSAQELVVRKETTPVLAESVEGVRAIVLPTVLGKFKFLDDVRVDEALLMLADRRLAPARIDVVQFLQRRQPRRMPEDVIDERESRLLGDDVESLANRVEIARGPVGGLHHTLFRGVRATAFRPNTIRFQAIR